MVISLIGSSWKPTPLTIGKIFLGDMTTLQQNKTNIENIVNQNSFTRKVYEKTSISKIFQAKRITITASGLTPEIANENSLRQVRLELVTKTQPYFETSIYNVLSCAKPGELYNQMVKSVTNQPDWIYLKNKIVLPSLNGDSNPWNRIISLIETLFTRSIGSFYDKDKTSAKKLLQNLKKDNSFSEANREVIETLNESTKELYVTQKLNLTAQYQDYEFFQTNGIFDLAKFDAIFEGALQVNRNVFEELHLKGQTFLFSPQIAAVAVVPTQYKYLVLQNFKVGMQLVTIGSAAYLGLCSILLYTLLLVQLFTFFFHLSPVFANMVTQYLIYFAMFGAVGLIPGVPVLGDLSPPFTSPSPTLGDASPPCNGIGAGDGNPPNLPPTDFIPEPPPDNFSEISSWLRDEESGLRDHDAEFYTVVEYCLEEGQSPHAPYYQLKYSLKTTGINIDKDGTIDININHSEETLIRNISRPPVPSYSYQHKTKPNLFYLKPVTDNININLNLQGPVPVTEPTTPILGSIQTTLTGEKEKLFNKVPRLV